MTGQMAVPGGATDSRGKLSSGALTFGGVILIGLGLYFIFIRPALLPEDPRFMGTTLDEIRAGFPGMLLWLPRVFWVMGGYMVSTGLLTCYLARTTFRSRAPGAAWVAALSGGTSIGLRSRSISSSSRTSGGFFWRSQRRGSLRSGVIR